MYASELCDQIIDCAGEDTDEHNCLCSDDQFTCSCFTNENPTCSRSVGCIPHNFANDGKWDCPGREDDPHLINVHGEDCGTCGDVKILRLDDLEGCAEIGLPNCDISTCGVVPSLMCEKLGCNLTNAVCLSQCPDNAANMHCKTFFQCANGELILGHKFCNGNTDCSDLSDEVTSGFGFQCSYDESNPVSCILPQRNIFDGNVAQCFNGLDLIRTEETDRSRFFRCFDKKLYVAKTQLCDGFINCFDLSDECLCRNNLLQPICETRFIHDNPYQLKCGDVNQDCNAFLPNSITDAKCQPNTVLCSSKYGDINATKCDRIPECSDFKDECDSSCDKPLPGYCNNRTCKPFFQMGDRYCDGLNDPSSTLLNTSRCPDGFDENPEDCPERFYCKSGNFVSIPKRRINDGIRNCDDGSDEREFLFSSEEELIKSDAIKVFIWTIGIFTLLGNAYVIKSTACIFNTKQLNKILRTNHILVLNLSVADFIMGIYMLIIAVQSVRFSGFYRQVDLEWRSSTICMAAGILAVISSELSCFVMSILSTFRLFNLLRPIKSLTDPIKPWFVLIILVWIFVIMLAVIPVFPVLENTFQQQLWFSSPFAQNQFLLKNETLTFLCRHISATNRTNNLNGKSWHDIMFYLSNAFPEYSAKTVSFYGEISVCMPRFYVDNTDTISGYSIFIISLNFISFIYVCVSYIIAYKIMSKRPISKKQADIQNQKMQRRIARLLVTDFCCWIPLSVIAYVKFATNVELPPDLYVVTIAFLLPVNSALNPLLYSSVFEKLYQRLASRLLALLRRKPCMQAEVALLDNKFPNKNRSTLEATKSANTQRTTTTL